MVSRAVGAAALFVLAASSAFAQPFDPGMAGPGVPTSSEPLLGSGPSTLNGSSGSRFWLSGGYQLGFFSSVPTPATVATQGGTFAIQGAPGVTSALGGGSTGVGAIHGGNLNAGFWLDSNRAFGIEASLFIFGEGSTSTTVTGGGAALSRPFFDTSIQGQNVRILNLPGQVTGSVTSQVKSQFWGVDLGPIIRVIETDMISADQIFYFRYLGLTESQDINDSVSPTGGAVTFRGQAIRTAGSSVSVLDSAATSSHFYGGGAGMRLAVTPGRFSATFTGKAAVGFTYESLILDGTTTLSGPGGATANGGLLVPGASAGRYVQSKFAWVPEAGIKLGYQFTENIGVSINYNFLYISNVARPGGFATSVNPTQLPSSQNFGVNFGPNAAPVQIQTSDFWMHSIGASLNVKF